MAQNWVKNPSFEAHANCPERLGNFNVDVENWSTPTQGSTDYFNGCSTTMGTPKNFNGTQLADFGVGYAGLYLYAPQHYREYLQAELLKKLEKGRKYRVSFYVSLAERSDFAVKEFGVLFSNHKLGFNVKRNLSKHLLYQKKDNQYHGLEIQNPDFYSETRDWVLVETEFTAKGSELFMLIGNFKSDARTRLVKTKRNAKHGAYYYLDMVEVTLLENKSSSSNMVDMEANSSIENFELDKVHVFKEVLFEFDEFRLLDEAEKALQALLEHLRNNVSFHVVIHGHTDNVGSDSYNQELSEQRAKSVADYLIRSGIAGERISWQGHGGKMPMADNKTESGRMKNRRVEFVLENRH